MAVLKIDNYLGRVKNRIAYVGIELEGGWTAPTPLHKIGTDGSVFAGGSTIAERTRAGNPRFKYGEIPSPPLEPVAFPKWLKTFHPDVVDKTCGMHVHMSFKHSQYYEQLMEKDYFDTLIHYFEVWGHKFVPSGHHFWERLQGRNSYCKKEFHPRAQVLATNKSYDHGNPTGRYTFLNYCWRYRGTIECRLLPVFDTYDLSYKAIRSLIDITNATLVAMKQKRERISEAVMLETESIEEVDHERL